MPMVQILLDGVMQPAPTCPSRPGPVFPGGSATSAAKALLDMQMLLPGEEGRFTRRFSRAVPGRPRLYGINVDRVMVYKAG